MIARGRGIAKAVLGLVPRPPITVAGPAPRDGDVTITVDGDLVATVPIRGGKCDHSVAPGGCTACDAATCLACRCRRADLPSGERKTLGGVYCDRPACLAAERAAYGVAPPWRRS